MFRQYKLPPALGGKIIDGMPVDDKLISVELDGRLVSLPADLLMPIIPMEPFGMLFISLTATVKEQERRHSVWERLQFENASKPFRRIDSQTQMATWTDIIDLMYNHDLTLTMWRPSTALYHSDYPTPTRAMAQGTCAVCGRVPVGIRLDGKVKQHKPVNGSGGRGQRYCPGSDQPPKEARN